MKNSYFQIWIFLSFVILLSTISVVAQNSKKVITTNINSVVQNENGTPIQGAIVYGDEGAAIAKTDASGKFSILLSTQKDLLIESDGYEPAIFRSGEYNNLKVFSLKTSSFQFGDKDAVNVAFRKVKKGELVNAVSVLNPVEILKYDDIQSVGQALSGRVPGLYGSTNIREIGNALYIVDGLPRDINTINLSEVAGITVLKDINSSILYGSAAVNGVVLVTTKRGQAHKKLVNVSGFYGVSAPAALPKYLSSADYMTLYNEAKVNDGLLAPYSPEMISNYSYGNPYRYPNVDYYSKENLKDVRPFSKIMTELSGGNDIVTYYANYGWNQTGSLLNFGAGKTGRQNRFNVRGNVDIKINNWIRSSLDAVAVLDNTKGAIGNYWSEAATMRPNLFSPLIPLNLIDPNNALVKYRKNDVNGTYLLGGSSSNLTNAFGNGYSGGVNENIQRTFSFNNRIDFDLKQFVKGLTFHTNVSFDFYVSYDQAISNSYSVYQPTWSATKDSIIGLAQFGADVRSGTQVVGNSSFQRRFGFYGMFDYNRTFSGLHQVTGSLFGYGTKYKIQGDFQGITTANLGLRLGYIYDRKYLFDFSGTYANSVKLPVGNRGAFSPSLGIAWIMSSEDFMSSVSEINYLKLRVSGGLLNSEEGIDGFYFYDNNYNKSSAYWWFDGSYRNFATISSNGGNGQLGFEKRKDLNLGIESILFNHQISFDANVFTSTYSDQITRTLNQYPSFYNNFIPYENFDSNSYRGAELGLSYNRSIGDFKFVIGTNFLYATSKVVKKDENFADQYQYRAGRPLDARFGLVADGFFADQAEINSHAIQAFGTVKPGDIKYVDQNNNGIIDANDEIQIGRWQAPFSYGLNLKFAYKNFTFFAKGNGFIGADGYLSDNYYWVDGNDKYSEYVLNRWTEATKTTATFPRLSSLANSNNFRSSTFWLYKDNYFTIDRVQLTYEMPEKATKLMKMKNLLFYVNASNLITFSKYKDFRDLRVGNEPNYRSFSLGLKTMF